MSNNQLIIDTYLDARLYVKKVIDAIRDISDNFMTGQENLALKGFVEIIDGLEWLTNVISLTKDNHSELGMKFEGYDTLVTMLGELVAALENNDYVLIGDLLNYEIKPILEKWAAELQSFEERHGMA